MPHRLLASLMLLAAGLLALAAPPASAAPAANRGVRTVPEGRMVEWDTRRDGNPRTWRSGNVTITLSTRRGESAPIPVITVRVPGRPVFRHEGQEGMPNVLARFGVGRIDPSAPGPQVLFTSYSGGAHCCTWIQLLEFSGGRWRAVDVREWDGEGLVNFPVDVNGDGVRDLVMADNRFDYAFDSHAGSFMPPQILNVRDGRVVDVSTDPSYRRIFESALAEVEPICREHANGACAAFVAIAARLGRAEWAWPIMMASYDRTVEWPWPTDCRVRIPASGACPDDQTITFAGMPQSLSWFLQHNGYTRDLIAPIR